MNYAKFVGWGRYLPSLVVRNKDLVRFVDTTDDWILSRTGIKERRYSHVSTGEMGWLSAERALACAGMLASDLDVIVLGSTTPNEVCPNTASAIKNKLRANSAAAIDLNSACTSWLYGVAMISDMIKAGSIETGMVIGAERLSLGLDWNKRESCCLFGDGAGAVILTKSHTELGFIASRISCVPDSREFLAIPKWGIQPAVHTNDLHLSMNFDGAAIFKRAVKSMSLDCQFVLDRAGLTIADVDIFIPHQANIRIINAVGSKLGIDPSKTVVTIDKFGNTSAASIPISLCEALKGDVIKGGDTILIASFGAGLSCGAALLKWGTSTKNTVDTHFSIPPFQGDVRDLLADSFSYHGINYN
ncbi:MAG: ketoacyl-ACP synthase III [Cellvibrionales bacterium TMED148]|nr:3-oxoacyl-ACP synthase [Porticoccaceae bacterium]RPG89644.1 MAG: ketoacyl-ACP synthase III [Cellvibrionales bacterium TMED148]